MTDDHEVFISKRGHTFYIAAITLEAAKDAINMIQGAALVYDYRNHYY